MILLLALVLAGNGGAMGGGAIGSGGGGGSTFTGGAVTSAITLPVGTCAAPSLSITGHTGTGIYYVNEAGEEAIGFCVHGVAAGLLGFAPATSANGQGNTVYGSQAAPSLDLSGVGAALNNTLVGGESGNKLTTGQQVTCFGSRTCHEVTTATQITGLGQGALFWNTAGDNVAVGFHAGLNQTTGLNTIMGSQAMEGHTTLGVGDSTANAVTAIGHLAMQVATTANQDTVVGETVAQRVTTATGLALFGFQTGNNITNGGNNAIFGSNSLTSCVSCAQNAAVGGNTLQSTTGNDNTAAGFGAGLSVAAGADNTLLGWEAGFAGTALTSGSNNILIGSGANAGSAAASNRIAIGQGVAATTDNQVLLGNASATTLSVGGTIWHLNAPSTVTTGSCTAETLRAGGSEYAGEITATCTAQTWIVAWTTTYTRAPVCEVIPMNAAATADVGTVYTTSTANLTVTVTTATTSGVWTYRCTE